MTAAPVLLTDSKSFIGNSGCSKSGFICQQLNFAESYSKPSLKMLSVVGNEALPSIDVSMKSGFKLSEYRENSNNFEPQQ
jgi:hypothetical protein